MAEEFNSSREGQIDLISRIAALEAIVLHVMEPLLETMPEEVAADVIARARSGLPCSCTCDDLDSKVIEEKTQAHIASIVDRLDAILRAGGTDRVRN